MDEKGNPQGFGRVFKNELAGRKKEERKKTDFNSIFEKICSDSPLDIQEVVPEQKTMNLE
ncbi:MAG: hypothetical protein IK147_02845 [Clostridia bacterium]|nr:hypothetical protein [Clostridia bacterium]